MFGRLAARERCPAALHHGIGVISARKLQVLGLDQGAEAPILPEHDELHPSIDAHIGGAGRMASIGIPLELEAAVRDEITRFERAIVYRDRGIAAAARCDARI